MGIDEVGTNLGKNDIEMTLENFFFDNVYE